MAQLRQPDAQGADAPPRIARRQQFQGRLVDLVTRRDRSRLLGLPREMLFIRPVDDTHRDHAPAPPGCPQAAADHIGQAHQQLLEVSLGGGRAGQHVRVAVALARGGLETAGFKATQPQAPAARNVHLHAGEPQPGWRRPQKLNRGLDAGACKASCCGVRDAGQVGELEGLEDGDEVGVIDAPQPVALVEVGRLLGHPDRGRRPDRSRHELADLGSNRRLDRAPDAFRPELFQAGRPGEVRRRLVD